MVTETPAALAPAALVDDLLRRGVWLRLDGDHAAPVLRARAPAGVITPALRDAIAEAKPALVRWLTTYPCSDCGRYAFRSPTLCYWCRRAQEPRGQTT